MERGVELWARSYAQRIQKDIAAAAANGTRVEDLLGAVPTEPHYTAQEFANENASAYSRDQARRMFYLSRKARRVTLVGRKKDRKYWGEKKGKEYIPKKPPRRTGSAYKHKKG